MTEIEDLQEEVERLTAQLVHTSSALTSMVGVVRHVLSSGNLALAGSALADYQRAVEDIGWLRANA